MCSKGRSQEPWGIITEPASAQLRPTEVSRRWPDEEGGMGWVLRAEQSLHGKAKIEKELVF